MPDDIHEVLAELRTKVAYINDEVTNMREDMDEMKRDITEIKSRLSKMEAKLSNYNTMALIIKYVVTPLIIIVGALVGVKIVLP